MSTTGDFTITKNLYNFKGTGSKSSNLYTVLTPNSGTWDIVANATPWTPWTLPITRTTPATKDVHPTHIASEFNFIMLNMRIKLVTTIDTKQKLGILQVRRSLSKEVGTLPEGDSWNSGLRWCWKDYPKTYKSNILNHKKMLWPGQRRTKSRREEVYKGTGLQPAWYQLCLQVLRPSVNLENRNV